MCHANVLAYFYSFNLCVKMSDISFDDAVLNDSQASNQMDFEIREECR